MEKIKNRAKEVLNKDNYSYYCTVRDTVSEVYLHYIGTQIGAYGPGKIDGEMLGDESLLLTLDIVQNHPGLSIKDIADIAIREADVDREWHR